MEIIVRRDFGGYNCKHCQTRLTCLDQDRKLMLMIFAICHLSAMTSVVTNPVMYGFLNENFKTSLVYILSNFYCFKRIFPTNLQVRSNKYCPFPTWCTDIFASSRRQEGVKRHRIYRLGMIKLMDFFIIFCLSVLFILRFPFVTRSQEVDVWGNISLLDVRRLNVT